MRKVIATVFSLALLFGCAAIQQQQARQQFAADQAACHAKVPKAVGFMEQRARCVLDNFRKDIEPAFPADADRLEILGTQMVLFGQDVDQHKLSVEEADAKLAVLLSQLSEQLREEAKEQQAAVVQSTAASAQLLGASAALLQAGRPTYVAPQPAPVTTSCYQNGAFTNCTSQ